MYFQNTVCADQNGYKSWAIVIAAPGFVFKCGTKRRAALPAVLQVWDLLNCSDFSAPVDLFPPDVFPHQRNCQISECFLRVLNMVLPFCMMTCVRGCRRDNCRLAPRRKSGSITVKLADLRLAGLAIGQRQSISLVLGHQVVGFGS